MTLENPCALNLTIKPDLPGFSLIPFEVPLGLGAVASKFRVSVPVNFYEGNFYIKWRVLGEDIPPYYTPISKTKVIITAKKGKNTLNLIIFKKAWAFIQSQFWLFHMEGPRCIQGFGWTMQQILGFHCA